MANISKKEFTSGALWKITEQFLTKGISMLVSVFLMRLLSAKDFGLIALTAIFTNLSDVLIDGGFSTVLIRKESVDDEDYACVFSISSSIAAVLYCVLFFCAPMVASFYKVPALTTVLRVIGLTFFIQAFASTRNAVVNRNMQFKLLFICNTIAGIVSGIAGIIAACMGLGVWSLVIQRLSQQSILTILLFLKIKFRIRWRFDWQRLKGMLKFSAGVVGSSLLNFAGGNIYGIAIGKVYAVDDLGYYDKGGQLPMQFSLYTFGAMSTVLLPTLSSSQSDLERVKRIVRKVVVMTSFLIMPMMLGMAFVSREMIVILFSEKWLPAVRIMQYTCLYYLATPFMLINVQVFFALGKSHLRVKTECIRLALNAVGLAVFGILLHCGINGLSLVAAFVAVITALVTFVDTRRLIGYQWNELASDMAKPFLATLVMGAVLYGCSAAFIHDTPVVLSLLLKLAVGAGSYFLISLLLKQEGLQETISMLKGMMKKRTAQ